MDPKEFSWTEDQRITVTNPTSEPHRFKVHNKEYVLEAGKTATMPGYIAWIYVYEMAAKQAQADDKFNRWNEEDFRPTYYEKFVAGVSSLVETVTIEESPIELLSDSVDDESAEETVKPKQYGKPAKTR